jgi:hypothetical protein
MKTQISTLNHNLQLCKQQISYCQKIDGGSDSDYYKWLIKKQDRILSTLINIQ